MPGGFPGMGGRRGPPKEIDNSKYYELLGAEKTATYDEIRKAFRKLALKNHPDRGGDKEKFQELNGAYEVLSDKEKRDIYDKYGEDGLKEGGGGGGGMDDLLSQMFGGGGRRGPGGPPKPKKGKPVMHPMKLTLEDIYNGKSTKIAVNRERICKDCNGKKVLKEKKIIDVEIDKGTPDKYEYKFHGEADEAPGMEPGDVVIVCQ